MQGTAEYRLIMGKDDILEGDIARGDHADGATIQRCWLAICHRNAIEANVLRVGDGEKAIAAAAGEKRLVGHEISRRATVLGASEAAVQGEVLAGICLGDGNIGQGIGALLDPDFAALLTSVQLLEGRGNRGRDGFEGRAPQALPGLAPASLPETPSTYSTQLLQCAPVSS